MSQRPRIVPDPEVAAHDLREEVEVREKVDGFLRQVVALLDEVLVCEALVLRVIAFLES